MQGRTTAINAAWLFARGINASGVLLGVEQKNLAARQPKKTAELRAKLRAWQKSMKAKMPVPNPAYKAPVPNSK